MSRKRYLVFSFAFGRSTGKIEVPDLSAENKLVGIGRRRVLYRMPLAMAAVTLGPFSLAFAQPVRPTNLLTLHHAGPGLAHLLFIGTRHTFDRHHPELVEMQTLIRLFKPDVALIEGGNWQIDLEPFDLVSRYGEMAFAKRLSSDLGAITQEADPPFELEIRHVAEQFDTRLVKLFYVLRMVPGLLASNAGTASERLRHWMNLPYLNVSPQMREVITTEEELNDALHSFAPRFRSWREAGDTMATAPTGKLSILNEVARRSVAFREGHAVSAVITHMKQGSRVLLVMGAGHVEALEGSLKSQLESALPR